MKNVKSTLCLVLVFSLVILLALAGCGGKINEEPKQTDSTADAISTQSVSESTPEPLSPVTLSWYYIGTYPQPDQDSVFKKLNELIQTEINATVDFMGINWGDYDTKMQTMIAAAEEFDLSLTTGGWVNLFSKNVSKGAFLELDDLIKAYGQQSYAQIPEKFWDAVKVKGKIYAMPNYQFSAKTPSVCFEKQIVEKAGFDVNSVTTDFKTLEPLMESIARNQKDVTPIFGDYEDFIFAKGVEKIASICGTYADDTSGKIINIFKSPEFFEFVQLHAQWNAKGYTNGKAMISGAVAAADLLKQGKVGILASNQWAPGIEAVLKASYIQDFIVTKIGTPYMSTGSIQATMTAISKTSKNPERAMMLIELFNTESDLINTITYGIEDKHYKKLDGNYIEAIPDSGYATNGAWEWGTTFNSYLLKGQDADVYEQQKKVNAEAKASPLLGFVFDAEPVKTEISQCDVAVTEVTEGFKYGILNAESDYQKFIEKLETAGAQKVVDEMQKQVDAWKATK